MSAKNAQLSPNFLQKKMNEAKGKLGEKIATVLLY